MTAVYDHNAELTLTTSARCCTSCTRTTDAPCCTAQLTAAAVAQLLEQSERYGLSYLHKQAAQLENFAPVVAELAGK